MHKILEPNTQSLEPAGRCTSDIGKMEKRIGTSKIDQSKIGELEGRIVELKEENSRQQIQSAELSTRMNKVLVEVGQFRAALQSGRASAAVRENIAQRKEMTHRGAELKWKQQVLERQEGARQGNTGSSKS